MTRICTHYLLIAENVVRHWVLFLIIASELEINFEQ